MSRTVVLYLLASIFNSLPIFSEGNPLQNVLDVIVAEHPESKSLAGLSKSHKSHFESSGILPDPKIGFAYRNYPTRNGYSIGGNNALDTPTMTGIEFSVSQEFPFPGKLGTEKRIAKTIETEANLSYTLGVNRLVSDLLLRVNKFQRTEKKRLLNLKIIDLLNSQKVISEGYYSSGSIPLTGTIKVSVAKTSAMEKETEYITLLGDLSNQLEYYNVSNKINIQDLKGMDLDSFVEGGLKKIEDIGKSPEDFVQKTPDLKILKTEEKKLKEQVLLSKYNISPQTEVFFSYMKRKEQNFSLDKGPLNYGLMDVTEYRGDLFSFGLNMRIPAWSGLKWDSIVGESLHLAEVGKYNLEKIQNQMQSELNRNLQVIRGTSDQIKILEKKLIPELEKIVKANSLLYVPGRTNFQDTLIAQTEVLNKKILLEDLRERKSEAILNTLKLLSLAYEDRQNAVHERH